ncbi:MAG TPA: hypothetical protein VF928_09325 [Usitatibacteraceae bacterium]
MKPAALQVDISTRSAQKPGGFAVHFRPHKPGERMPPYAVSFFAPDEVQWIAVPGPRRSWSELDHYRWTQEAADEYRAAMRKAIDPFPE